MSIEVESDLPRLIEALDAASLRAFSKRLGLQPFQALCPPLILWLDNELTGDVEHRAELKTRTPTLPHFSAWGDKEIAGALAIAAEMHTQTVSEPDEQFVKALLHILAANAVIRLQFPRKESLN